MCFELFTYTMYREQYVLVLMYILGYLSTDTNNYTLAFLIRVERGFEEKKLRGHRCTWSHLETGGQWLSVQANKNKEWCPLGAVLGPLLFNMLINDTNSGIECTLNKFAETKLSGVADSPEGGNAIQRDLGRMKKKAHVYLRFNKARCKALNMGQATSSMNTGCEIKRLRAALQKRTCRDS